jgi:hypothetical protein
MGWEIVRDEGSNMDDTIKRNNKGKGKRLKNGGCRRARPIDNDG